MNLGENKLSNFHMLTTSTGFISTKLFCSRCRRCPPAHGGQFEHLLWLPCIRCKVLLVFLALFFFNFLNFMLTVWTTAFLALVVWFVIRYRNSTYRSFWRSLSELYQTLEHKAMFSWYREHLEERCSPSEVFTVRIAPREGHAPPLLHPWSTGSLAHVAT